MTSTIVIGAGISGLVAAYRLASAGQDVLLLDANERPGGVIRTETVDGFTVELGPNSVRMTDELEALVAELGIEGELLSGSPRAPRYVFFEGRLQRAPMGPASLLTTKLLSARAKLRLLGEPLAGAPSDGGEPSIAEFVTRRLGREIHDVLVSAFISGIYAGDTTKLSAEAIFPKLVELEREHGSLVRGGIAEMRRNRRDRPAGAPRPPRRPLTISSFESGLSRLPERIAEALGDRVRLATPVAAVERRGDRAARDRFVVLASDGEHEAAHLVVATPAYVAAGLLRPHAPRLGELLDAIEYPPLASVSLAYELKDVAHSCEGFGFLAPRMAGLRILGSIFGSSLFPNRAPEGWHSFTCFVGGATDPGATELDDEALVGAVAADLERAVGARGTPRVLSVTRWAHAIPQYTIGHPVRVREIEREGAALGVRLLGNYLHGVSVGECVAAASRAHMIHEDERDGRG